MNSHPARPSTEGRTFDRHRLSGFVRKEWLQVLRDPSSVVVAVLLPLLLLFLFGYGMSLDAKQLPLAVVVESNAPEAHDLLAAFRATPYVAPRVVATRPQAVELLRQGAVQGVAVIGDDFGEKFGRGAAIQVIVNGTDANTARLMIGYVQGVTNIWMRGHDDVHGRASIPPITVRSRVWFNETVDSHRSIVPGLIAVIMTLIGALLTALVIAREWERGTMEALLTTPLTKAELIIGKLVPYFVLGMGGMAVSVTVALAIFHIGFAGSLLVLLLTAACFMLTVLGFGLMVSTLTRNQFAAAIIAIMATLMPAILLSGLVFDIRSMPPMVRAFTFAVPARYFVDTLKTLFLAGNVWTVILPNTAALIAMTLIFLSVTVRKTKRGLE